MAQVPGKKVVRYRTPVLRDGRREWIDIEEFDTGRLIGDWEGDSYFQSIPQEFLEMGEGRSGKIGAAKAYLFDAASLHNFAVRWLEGKLRSKT